MRESQQLFFGLRIVGTYCRIFLYLAAENFELFYKIQNQNKKIKKPIVVDVLPEAYP